MTGVLHDREGVAKYAVGRSDAETADPGEPIRRVTHRPDTICQQDPPATRSRRRQINTAPVDQHQSADRDRGGRSLSCMARARAWRGTLAGRRRFAWIRSHPPPWTGEL